MGQRLTCPCYSRTDPKNLHSEIVTPSTVQWQDVGMDGLPSVEGHHHKGFTPPVARKLFENPPSESDVGLESLTPTTRGDSTGRESSGAPTSPGLVQSLFGTPTTTPTGASTKCNATHDSPACRSEADEQQTPEVEGKYLEGRECTERETSSGSRQVVESQVGKGTGWCWVLKGKYCQRAELLPKGYQQLQSEGLVQQVRHLLSQNGFSTFAEQVEEQRVVRYLVGNGMDVKVVTELLGTYAKWHEQCGIAEIRKKACDDPMERYPHFREVCQVVPMSPCAVMTSLGYPVAIYRIGCLRFDLLKELEQHKVIEMFRYINEYLDSLIFAKTEQNKVMMGTIQIFDLNGLKPYMLEKIKLMMQRIVKPVVRESTKYYVEEKHHTFLVNTPLLFLPLWYIVKLWLDSRTESKVTVSTGVPQELYEMVGRDKVPKFLGGDSLNNYGLGD